MINIYFGLIFETTSSYNYLYMTMNQYIVNILEIFVDFNYNHNLIITPKKEDYFLIKSMINLPKII